ncbi:MAG: type II toxin-antitoxin system VapC family toxin [Opitutaceae bacterium]
MTADTNVVVRLLVEDAPNESARAKRLFEAGAVFIPDTVFMETEWVLRAAYGCRADEIADAFRSLLRLETVRVADRTKMVSAIDHFSAGLDFADALHFVCGDGEGMKTFDRMFIKRGQRRGLAVSAP